LTAATLLYFFKGFRLTHISKREIVAGLLSIIAHQTLTASS